MQSDDVYRRSFEAASHQLQAFATGLHDAAHVEHEATPDYFRLSLKPHAQAACAVDVILHRSGQNFDVQFAGMDAWEAVPIGEDPRVLQAMLEAVVDGRIISRDRLSAATGQPLSRGVIVHEAAGAGWQFGSAPDDDATLVRDRHFAPYRRS